MDAYSYQPCPSMDSIKIEFLDIMRQKYQDKDIEFLKTIVDDCIDKFNNENDISKYSYTGYITFVRKDIMKIIDKAILLTIEDI